MGKDFTLYGKKQKMNHARSVKTDALKCHSCAGFIQFEKTPFLISSFLFFFFFFFFCSAGKKNISHPIVAEVKHFPKFQISRK